MCNNILTFYALSSKLIILHPRSNNVIVYTIRVYYENSYKGFIIKTVGILNSVFIQTRNYFTFTFIRILNYRLLQVTYDILKQISILCEFLISISTFLLIRLQEELVTFTWSCLGGD